MLLNRIIVIALLVFFFFCSTVVIDFVFFMNGWRFKFRKRYLKEINVGFYEIFMLKKKCWFSFTT